MIEFLPYVTFWDKYGTDLDDVIKKIQKYKKKNTFLGKNYRNTYFTILHPIDANLYHCDDSKCISSKLILEKYIQFHTKYTWF